MSKKAKKGKADIKGKTEFKYPSDKELLDFEMGLRSVVFNQILTQQVIEANEIVLGGLDYITPYIDILVMHNNAIQISEELHRKSYPQWGDMDEKLQNKILRFREKAAAMDSKGLNMMEEVVNFNAQQMSKWSDKLLVKLETLQVKLSEAIQGRIRHDLVSGIQSPHPQ